MAFKCFKALFLNMNEKVHIWEDNTKHSCELSNLKQLKGGGELIPLPKRNKQKKTVIKNYKGLVTQEKY